MLFSPEKSLTPPTPCIVKIPLVAVAYTAFAPTMVTAPVVNVMPAGLPLMVAAPAAMTVNEAVIAVAVTDASPAVATSSASSAVVIAGRHVRPWSKIVVH